MKIKSKKDAINAMMDKMNGMNAQDAKEYAEKHCMGGHTTERIFGHRLR